MRVNLIMFLEATLFIKNVFYFNSLGVRFIYNTNIIIERCVGRLSVRSLITISVVLYTAITSLLQRFSIIDVC